jgi:hypothetical protein
VDEAGIMSEPMPLKLAVLLNHAARLKAVPRLGRDFRREALALADADIDGTAGLVVQGVAHEARIYEEFAVCWCNDEKHEYRRDAPRGRAHWHSTRRHAEAELREAIKGWMKWYKPEKQSMPHLVCHYVASTPTVVAS